MSTLALFIIARLLVVSTMQSIQKLINNNAHLKLHNVIHHYYLSKIIGKKTALANFVYKKKTI